MVAAKVGAEACRDKTHRQSLSYDRLSVVRFYFFALPTLIFGENVGAYVWIPGLPMLIEPFLKVTYVF